jgi:hypothetical protein
MMLVSVQAQVAPAPSALIVIDLAHASGDDRERLTGLARAIALDAETRVWTGLRDDPVAKYRLSFAEAFDIFRGNASVLQTVRARECADGVSSCGADLPVRARQSLDAFDEVARATVSQLESAATDLAARARPRPHAIPARDGSGWIGSAAPWSEPSWCCSRRQAARRARRTSS